MGGGAVVPLETVNQVEARRVSHVPGPVIAFAIIACVPLETCHEFQLACHEAAPSQPTSTLSTYHLIWVMPLASDADAVSETVPETVAPAVGHVTPLPWPWAPRCGP